jgi:hypothetical protein
LGHFAWQLLKVDWLSPQPSKTPSAKCLSWTSHKV